MERRRFGRPIARCRPSARGPGTTRATTTPPRSPRCAFLELGMTHIDTAEMYGSGTAEEMVAEASPASRPGLPGLQGAPPARLAEREGGFPTDSSLTGISYPQQPWRSSAHRSSRPAAGRVCKPVASNSSELCPTRPSRSDLVARGCDPPRRPPPRELRMTHRTKTVLALAVGSVLLVGGFGPCIYLGEREISRVQVVADAFMDQLSQGRVDEAYAATSLAFKDTTTPEAFRAMVAQYPAITKPTPRTVVSVRVDQGGKATVLYNLASPQDTLPVKLVLGKGGDEWRVLSFALPAERMCGRHESWSAVHTSPAESPSKRMPRPRSTVRRTRRAARRRGDRGALCLGTQAPAVVREVRERTATWSDSAQYWRVCRPRETANFHRRSHVWILVPVDRPLICALPRSGAGRALLRRAEFRHPSG